MAADFIYKEFTSACMTPCSVRGPRGITAENFLSGLIPSTLNHFSETQVKNRTVMCVCFFFPEN